MGGRRIYSSIRNRICDDSIADKIGFAFIKPGFDWIEMPFTSDLEKFEIEVAHKKRLILPEQAFEFIYRDSRERHFYADMKHYLANHAVIAMILTSEESTQEKLLNLKHGLNGYPNLRNNYRPPDKVWVTEEEIRLWNHGMHPRQYDTTVSLTQSNAFHTADSTEDALMSLCAIKENAGHFLTPGDIKYNKLGWLARAIDLGDIMDTIRKTVTSRTWKDGKEIHPEDQTLPVNQVYAWLFTTDDKIAIVSKDGKKWQLPGGKPSKHETYLQTAIREVAEETGITTESMSDRYKFFGYYDIAETDELGNDDEYLQLRVSLMLDNTADEYTLHQQNEDEEQIQEEQIRYAKFVTIDELIKHIPWTRESAELQAAIQSQVAPTPL